MTNISIRRNGQKTEDLTDTDTSLDHIPCQIIYMDFGPTPRPYDNVSDVTILTASGSVEQVRKFSIHTGAIVDIHLVRDTSTQAYIAPNDMTRTFLLLYNKDLWAALQSL